MKSFLISLLLAALIRPLDSQILYTWNGSVNNSFSTAGNWTPFRQYMYPNDILIIEKGGNVSITNVNQITVGQLIIRNNTSVSMTPSEGSPRILSVQGNSGDDFIIDAGSELNIWGDNPKLSLFIKTGATASIYGILRFSGNAAHGINSQDPFAVIFKNGSFLYQNSTGYIFTNSGAQNSIVFKSGSSFVFNNVNAATPFGLAAPGSKVRFEKGSNFIFGVNSNSSFSVNGRSFPNLKVQNGINVSLADYLTNGITIDSVFVPASSTLEIINNNIEIPGIININGNMNINGLFKVGNGTNAIHNINLSGTELQSILGAGIIDFSSSSCMFINNDIRLFRDLILNCFVNNLNANVYSNEYKLIVRGKTINTQLYPTTTDNKPGISLSGPEEFSLKQNYPNPFNSQTNIEFHIPVSSVVSIKLFDITGGLISEILDKNLQQGSHIINYDSKDISSGVYFYTINAAGFKKTMKMIVVK